ncbi:MAG TPA: STAS domain-containing protein [Acidimicrobiales bacterium]|jgi:anti-anti-sigma factor
MTSASDLLLETSDDGETAAVTVHGSLEAATADELRRQLRFLIDSGHDRLDLDLADVWFLDGDGVGVLVGALKAQESVGGQLIVTATSPLVRRVLHIAGLDRLVAAG